MNLVVSAIMYPFDHLPAPLTTSEFYVLLALQREETHAYGLIGRVMNDSLGSVKLAVGTLYPLLNRLHDIGFVDMLEAKPSGISGKEGLAIGRAGGLPEDDTPVDIRRLLLDVQ